MAKKKYNFEEASSLAGQLFGKILSREADKGGYEHALDCLQTGARSIKQLVAEMIGSDEYIDRFVVPAGFEGAVKGVHRVLLGHGIDDLEELASATRRFARMGLKGYVDEIMASEEYKRSAGSDRVPGASAQP